MSKTIEAQARHAHRLALLILHAEQLGYVVTGGDWYRDPRCAEVYGSPKSKHLDRLATDLNLFSPIRDKAGGILGYRYEASTEAHEPLGRYWESIGGKWGVIKDGERTDGNHYESPE